MAPFKVNMAALLAEARRKKEALAAAAAATSPLTNTGNQTNGTLKEPSTNSSSIHSDNSTNSSITLPKILIEGNTSNASSNSSNQLSKILTKTQQALKQATQTEHSPANIFARSTSNSTLLRNTSTDLGLTNSGSVPSTKLSELKAKLLAANKKKQEPIPAPKVEPEESPASTPTPASTPASGDSVGMSGELITYNPQQQSYITTASSGKSCVLIGAAGTGKTTCSKGGIQGLIASGIIPTLEGNGHKYLVDGSPGILIISYTRRAVNNIRKVQSTDLQGNCITSHKLLEYQPVYYEIADGETGMTKRTMRFEPNRCTGNPLPPSIHTIVVEEASMLSVELYDELCAALPHKVQWIFIGDIQQLPPVFGSAILGFKMLELPVVELTTVYRQALKSPIIRLAHRVLSGKPIPAEEYESWKEESEHGKLTIHPWKKKISADNAALTLAAFFTSAIDKGVYNPDEDMILIPYNKGCGTIEVNKHIANYIAKSRGFLTYEVMAGFNKHYFTVGDKVLYDREDAEIIEIAPNQSYTGARIQPPSKNLDYWGHNPKLAEELAAEGNDSSYDMDTDDVDFLLAAVASSEERVTQASHRITVRLLDTASELVVTKAAEVNTLLHSYALTVHKAQGSEFRKVFFCLHQSHATMLQRELLYTGITRAREELYVICEPESFTKGILSQKIKGNTLAEKAEFFKGKLDRMNPATRS